MTLPHAYMPRRRFDIIGYVWHKEFPRAIFTIYNLAWDSMQGSELLTRNSTLVEAKKKQNVLGSSQRVRDAGLKLDVKFPNHSTHLFWWRHTVYMAGPGCHQACREASATLSQGQGQKGLAPAPSRCCLLLIGNLISAYLTAEPRAQACILASGTQGGKLSPQHPQG